MLTNIVYFPVYLNLRAIGLLVRNCLVLPSVNYVLLFIIIIINYYYYYFFALFRFPAFFFWVFRVPLPILFKRCLLTER